MPTTNPVPSTDPTDLLFNAGKLDEVVSGDGQYYTDRLGVNRRTMEGISAAADVVLGGIGYAPPVAYAAGISMTLTTQTVEYNGEIYAPKIANLPFTTSGTFETAKFRLIQGVASADLASGGGAAMVGYTPSGTGAVATTVQAKLRESVSVFDFMTAAQVAGCINGSIDVTAAIQNAITYIAINGGKLVFPYATYLISDNLILPFGNNSVDKLFTLDFGNSLVKSNVTTPTSSTFTCFVSGYLSGTTPVASITGTEVHVAANVTIANLNLSGFGLGVRLNNFNYGCALDNIHAVNCFNGLHLTRCFYIGVNNVSLRGTSPTAGGFGFRTESFTNIAPMSGIKTSQFTTGIQLGGFDGGKMTDCSAEGCQVGVDLISESSSMSLDTLYLEGNTVANLKVSAVARRCVVTNCWFIGDTAKNIISALDAGSYANFTFISTNFNGGVTNNPPLRNIFGDAINCDLNPTVPVDLSGIPNVRANSPRYEIDTSISGYNGAVLSMDVRQTNGLIPTAYSGKFRDGVAASNRAPYQTVVNNAGSFEFTTQFNNDGFTALLWRVSIAHNVATWAKTFIVIFDNDFAVWRLYQPTSSGLTLNTEATCTDNGGFLRLKAPTLTGPVVQYSVVRSL